MLSLDRRLMICLSSMTRLGAEEDGWAALTTGAAGQPQD